MEELRITKIITEFTSKQYKKKKLEKGEIKDVGYGFVSEAYEERFSSPTNASRPPSSLCDIERARKQ